MFIFALLLQFAFAEEPTVVQVMDPMPIISVDDGRKVPANEVGMDAPSVDTDMPSPLAPQAFDGFGGVVQEPFAPTAAELEEMRRKQQEEMKRLSMERMAQEKKAAAAMMATLPAKSGPAKVTAKPIGSKPVVAKPALAKAIAKKAVKTPAKRLPAASAVKTKTMPAAKPGALKVAPKQNKK